MPLQFNRSNNGTNQNANNQQSQQQPMWGNRQNASAMPFHRQGNRQNQYGQQSQAGYQNPFARQSSQGQNQFSQQQQGGRQNQSAQQQNGRQNQFAQPQQGSRQNQFAQQSQQGRQQNQFGQQLGGMQNQFVQQLISGQQNQFGQQPQSGQQNQFGQQPQGGQQSQPGQQSQGGIQNQSGQQSQSGMPNQPGHQQPLAQGAQPNPFTQPLPDGITLQPLDEKLLQEIKELNLNPASEPNQDTPEGQPIPAKQFNPVNMGFRVDDLETFIQNEQNGSKFYQYLAGESSREDHRDILSRISNSCTTRNNVFNTIYHQHKGKEFETKDAKINNTLGFDEGIRLAIHEESKSLRDLSDIYERVADDGISKSLNSQLYKKVSDLSFLHLIKNDSAGNHWGFR